MITQTLLLLITAFIVKHFIVDFLLQTKWQYSNKHIFGHRGGIFHAWLHGITTVIILDHFGFDHRTAAILGASEWIIHYFIDWSKMNIGMHYNWKCDNSNYFWWLLGLDQLLHYFTYVGIIYYLLTFV